jgi:hypothetical protein
MHKELYRIASETDSKKIADFLSKDDLPLMQKICETNNILSEKPDVAADLREKLEKMKSNLATYGNMDRKKSSLISRSNVSLRIWGICRRWCEWD